MFSEISVSDLDWWQFNTVEYDYWELKIAWVSEQTTDLETGKSGLYSQACHQPTAQPLTINIFILAPYTVSLFSWNWTESKRGLLCLWAKAAPSANATLSNVKWTWGAGERGQEMALVVQFRTLLQLRLLLWACCWQHGGSASGEE